jgi:hypothetical protein
VPLPNKCEIRCGSWVFTIAMNFLSFAFKIKKLKKCEISQDSLLLFGKAGFVHIIKALYAIHIYAGQKMRE